MLNSDIFGCQDDLSVGKYRSEAVNVNLKWGISLQADLARSSLHFQYHLKTSSRSLEMHVASIFIIFSTPTYVLFTCLEIGNSV